jgi:ligand-binding SRPBCC domain-containing protein
MVYNLKTTQRLPITLDKAWSFLSDPKNLAVITPPELGFKITCDLPPKMYEGMMISYTVRPLGPFPMVWVSEITHLNPPHFFVDEQRVGPYSLWHHEHHLTEIDGGVEMRDLITYKVPGGPLGGIINALMVRPQLNRIFAFREVKLNELFGAFA